MTPPPSVGHEELASVLGRILDSYVAASGLGRVHRPRAVLRVLESEVEPDLMVRPAADDDVVTAESLAWHPRGPSEPLVINVQAFFGEVVGERLARS